MATNKHATIRYLALDKCFRNPGRKYYINDLLEACNEALQYNDPKSEGIKKRQLYADIKFMEHESGYGVEFMDGKEGKERYYRYRDINFSIKNKGLNSSEAEQVKEALLILSRFKGMPQFEWVDEVVAKFESSFGLKKGAEKIIGFDENIDYTAVEHISTLFNAILHEQPLKINYKSFQMKVAEDFIIHPYYLKQYNNRWFCLGLNNELKKITTIALDRIIEIENKRLKFIKNTEINFIEYFDDVVGVTVPDSKPIEKIVLQITNERWPYIETKPLHNSQTRINKEEKKHVTVFLNVIPNFELDTLLLSYGNSIKVIEPIEFRNRLAEKVKNK
jgi:predicted DNA-binding transcriptional regulator YafY